GRVPAGGHTAVLVGTDPQTQAPARLLDECDRLGRVAVEVQFPLPHRLDRVPVDESAEDRKSTRLNSSHVSISYAVFRLKKKILHTISKRLDSICNLLNVSMNRSKRSTTATNICTSMALCHAKNSIRLVSISPLHATHVK